jgi:hypothetical protein
LVSAVIFKIEVTHFAPQIGESVAPTQPAPFWHELKLSKTKCGTCNVFKKQPSHGRSCPKKSGDEGATGKTRRAISTKIMKSLNFLISISVLNYYVFGRFYGYK